jgi:hypothetical protein
MSKKRNFKKKELNLILLNLMNFPLNQMNIFHFSLDIH